MGRMHRQHPTYKFEGTHHDMDDDSNPRLFTSTSSLSGDSKLASGDVRSSGTAVLSRSRVIEGASDILTFYDFLGKASDFRVFADARKHRISTTNFPKNIIIQDECFLRNKEPLGT